MQLRSLFLLPGILWLLVGCAASPKEEIVSGQRSSLMAPGVMKTLSTVQTKKASDLNDTERAALQEALANLESFCMPRLTAMETKASKQANNAFWLSVAGAISGAVIVPALTASNIASHGAAIAAFAGFSGTTNFLSQSLASSGLSGSGNATTRNAIVGTIWTNLNMAFNEQNTIGERLTAVDKAKAACVFYSIQVPSVPALPNN